MDMRQALSGPVSPTAGDFINQARQQPVQPSGMQGALGGLGGGAIGALLGGPFAPITGPVGAWLGRKAMPQQQPAYGGHGVYSNPYAPAPQASSGGGGGRSIGGEHGNKGFDAHGNWV